MKIISRKDKEQIHIEDYTSILDLLNQQRIFLIDYSEYSPSFVDITEACDSYYSLSLDREALEKLIAELQELVKGMK